MDVKDNYLVLPASFTAETDMNIGSTGKDAREAIELTKDGKLIIGGIAVAVEELVPRDPKLATMTLSSSQPLSQVVCDIPKEVACWLVHLRLNIPEHRASKVLPGL